MLAGGSIGGPGATNRGQTSDGATRSSRRPWTPCSSAPRIGCSTSVCGTGAGSRSAGPRGLGRRHQTCRRKMIRQARDLAEGIGKVDFEIADSEHLPSATGRSPRALSNSFHHYPDPRQAVREMATCARPGRPIVVGVPAGSRCGGIADASSGVRARSSPPVPFRRARVLLQDAGLSRSSSGGSPGAASRWSRDRRLADRSFCASPIPFPVSTPVRELSASSPRPILVNPWP